MCSAPGERRSCQRNTRPRIGCARGGSYFDVRLEQDTWTRDGVSYTVDFWREPLTSLCDAATRAGFLIERLLEPRPSAVMRERWPDDWEKLTREPGFLVMRLLKSER